MLWSDWRLADGRDCPADVRRLITALDRTAVLIYAGEGVWLLGTIDANRKQRQQARERITQQFSSETPFNRMSWADIELDRLKAKGLVVRWRYEQNDPDDRIVRHFRAMLWVEQNAVRSVEAMALEASTYNERTLPARQKLMLDAVESKARDAWKYGVRRDGSQRSKHFTRRAHGRQT